MKVSNDFLAQKVTLGPPLDNASPVKAIPYAHGPVLAGGEGPDIKLSLFPRGMF